MLSMTEAIHWSPNLMLPSNVFVYVPVPDWLVGEILATISARMREVSRTSPDPTETQPTPSGMSWPAALLARAVRESVEPLLTVWDLLAGRPGEWVSIEEIRRATGKTDRQLAGTWGQFTKRCARYGRSDWPIDSASPGGRLCLRLLPEAAEVVRRVRADMPG